MVNSLMLGAFYEGIIRYYFLQINFENNDYRYVKMSEVPVNNDKMSFYFIKGNKIILYKNHQIIRSYSNVVVT